MTHTRERRLREGVTVAVHRNAGLRKVCELPTPRVGEVPSSMALQLLMAWHPYRFSLNRYAGKEITGKTEAETLAEGIRREIRAGTFRGLPAAAITNEAGNDAETRIVVRDVRSPIHRAIQQRPRQGVVAG